ncbi:IgGFc-binding protein-like [Osmerus eperlanus]|uniref:IgGFc-binding protein-like n=1 Tax=Osmerus eperlanus TaxID=29151 RepID=UPI002E120BAB
MGDDQARFVIEVSALPSSHGSTNVKVTALGQVYQKSVDPGQGVAFQLPNGVEMKGSWNNLPTILIEASQEVTVLSLNYKEDTADTSVVYPVQEWGTEYYIFTPKGTPLETFKEFSITNHKNQNSVEIYLKANVRFHRRLYRAGSKLTFTLEPFESIQIQSSDDLTGCRVVSKQPVAVSTGHTCTFKFTSCDHVYEQLLPVNSWGKEFIIAPLPYHDHPNRYDSVFIQASQATNVQVNNGGKAMTLPMLPGQKIELFSQWPNPIHLTADKGIQVLFEFNGGPDSTYPSYDPFLMTVLPTSSFSTSYSLEGQADFTNMAVIIARSQDLGGLTLDQAPMPSDISWKQVGGSEYSWAEISYGSGAGFHQIVHPNSPFGVYSIGVVAATGYGSPASASQPEKLECSQMKCQKDEECQMKDNNPICVKKPPVLPPGSCWVMGDPHYRSFDGHYYNFMGNCTYTMAKNCHVDEGHPAFEVEAKNAKKGNSIVTFVAKIIINVYGYTITVVRSEFGLVRMDYMSWNLPITLNNGKLKIYQSGLSFVLETDFGLTVQYDWQQHLVVTVPGSFAGRTCGLCGNFNGKNEDDLTLPDGSPANNPTALGKSWRVPGLADDAYCRDECVGQCDQCNNGFLAHIADKVFCGTLSLIMEGPFKDCKAVIEPKAYRENCMFDVCMGEGMKNFLCDTLQVYSDACQREGVKIHDWRHIAHCPDPTCPENSHYEQCGSPCVATCENQNGSSTCKGYCVETCTCDDGFLRSGNKCVPKSQCGCEYKGHYVMAGASFWGDDHCLQRCTCSPTSNQVACVSFSCGVNEQCAVKNGIRTCVPEGQGVCSISGDPHYRTFDNTTYDFQGTCTYTAAQGCHLEGTHLTPFSVVVENEKWYGMSSDPHVSVAKLVAVEVYGNTLILRRNQIGMIMVNGVMTTLPLNLNEGAIQAYQDGTYDVIITDFGLKVTYDLVYHITVTVPGNYRGKTCGLCGNFNNNNKDDFQLPDGKAAKDLLTFGAAWKVGVPGAVCEDGCSGDQCPKCDDKKKVVFEKDCSIITNPNGPFATCHTRIDPASYFRDCVYDVCLSKGDRHVLCHSISAYTIDCQNLGVNIKEWRTDTFCPLNCPANSHYQVCSEICATPCPGLSDTITCPTTCAEGCACNPGHYFNGTGCVIPDQCSCYYKGLTYKIGESILSNDCQELCTCTADRGIQCQKQKCQSNERCQVRNAVRGCFPQQCVMETGGLFTLFGGTNGFVTASGAYEVVKACDGGLVAEWFRVVVKLEACGNTGVKRVVALYVFFDDLIISVNNKHETWVNGRTGTLPSLYKNEISVKVLEKTLVIEKVSGLRVSYSLSEEISITVSDNMVNKVCGACGKLAAINNNKMQLSMQEYIASWIAHDFSTCGL